MFRILGLSLAFLAGSALLAEEKEKPRPKITKLTAEVSKADAASLTVVQRGDSGEKTHAFTLDAKTKIILETDQDETVMVKSEGGEKDVTRPKRKDGTAADLKAGQRVMVTAGEDKKATEVVVIRLKKKKEGEGK